jgi:hypothetical protein
VSLKATSFCSFVLIYSFLASNILREQHNLPVTAMHFIASVASDKQIKADNSGKFGFFYLLRWHHTVCRMLDKQDQQQNIL